MKNSLRKVAGATLAMALVTSAAACSDSDSNDAGGDKIKIGVTQIVSHPSLDISVKGFQDALAAAGIDAEYDIKNALGEASNAADNAASLAADSDIDLVLAVATPTAQAAVGAINNKPIVFSAVTDPVSAQLVPGWDASGTNVTGVSDLNPEAYPAALIKELVPGVKTIGVLYSSSEINSDMQIKALEEEAAALGITVKRSAITNSSEVVTGAQALKGVDAIFIPTDNTVVSALETLVNFANENQIPLIASDFDSVARGATATRGVDYYQLGWAAGEIAARILKGENPGDIPVLVVKETKVIYNETAAKAQGITIPDSIKAAGQPAE